MRTALLFLVLGVRAAQGAVSWTCAAPEWMGSPEIEDGVLAAALGSDCRFRHVPEQGLSQLLKFIRHDIETSGKYTIHQGPTAAKREGIAGYRYDLTDELKDEGSPLVIRQDMFLGSDERSRLLYATQSTDVRGRGNAGYLQKVSFRTDIIRLEGADFLVRFENEVNVERPWFAFNFLFKPIGKGITQDKFLLARDKLIQYLAPHL